MDPSADHNAFCLASGKDSEHETLGKGKGSAKYITIQNVLTLSASPKIR